MVAATRPPESADQQAPELAFRDELGNWAGIQHGSVFCTICDSQAKPAILVALVEDRPVVSIVASDARPRATIELIQGTPIVRVFDEKGKETVVYPPPSEKE